MSGSRFFSLFFVDDGALMMVASLMVPSDSLIPFGFKMSVDLLEDPLTKVVGLKKMAGERRSSSRLGRTSLPRSMQTKRRMDFMS